MRACWVCLAEGVVIGFIAAFVLSAAVGAILGLAEYYGGRKGEPQISELD